MNYEMDTNENGSDECKTVRYKQFSWSDNVDEKMETRQQYPIKLMMTPATHMQQQS